jgi:hypothetical protein
MADRSNRESATREKQARKTDWKPPSTLDAPEAPIGYKHRWIRERVMDFDDKANVYKRRREGYELVRADEHPDFDTPVVDEGKNAGVIGQGGLLLARIPEEVADSRNDYFRKKTSNQMSVYDQELASQPESSAGRILKPERKSQVQFGGKKISNE